MTIETLNKASEIYNKIHRLKNNVFFLDQAEIIEVKKDDPLFKELRNKKIEEAEKQIAQLEEELNAL